MSDLGHRASLRRAASNLGHAFEEAAPAAKVLGADDPFVRALDLTRVMARQSLAAAGASAVGAGSLACGAGWALPVLVVAVAVQLVFAAGLAVVLALVREGARDLIAEGREHLPVPVLARQRRRLLDQRRRESLARAFEHVVATAERWPRILRTARPVFNVRLVREIAPELQEIGALLRVVTGSARGVVLSERLLTNGASPLYGAEIDELRSELRRIREALRSETPAEAAPAGRPRSHV
jgi:hypothetical protein